MGRVANSGPLIPQPLPEELGDGTWTLVLDLAPTNTTKLGAKMTGHATVTFSSGQVYPFDISGSYSSSGNRSRLVLKGKDAGLGSRLTMTMSGSQITKLTGVISSQNVSIK